jgi:hypothetical protein
MTNDWAGYAAFRSAFLEVMDPALYSIEWLDEQVATGAVMFWRSANAAIIAEIRHYPTGARDIHGLIAAGELSEIVGHLIPHAEQWAREQGCVGAIIESRPGWQRVLKEQGYEPYQIAVRKEL